jgi:GT2 family glycosyltransferase
LADNLAGAPIPTDPTVTVIVVNWNRRDMLRSCLQSLTGQTVSPLEIVIVDNGSSDGSVEMIEREFQTGSRVPIRLIRNRENRGFCQANNQGIELARGEYVALLNNDAEADARWLEGLSTAFAGRPDVGMAASKILVHGDPGRIDKAGHLIFLDGQNRGRGSGQRDVGQFDRTEEVLWPDGCAAMYRRAMLDQIGGFDEDFFAYADDAELGLRARIAGWGCIYVPQARVLHHRGTTLGLLSSRRVELIERNRILLVAKHFPWRILWLNGGLYLARLIAGAMAAARGKGEAGKFPGLKGKLRLSWALLKGGASAIPLIPRMFQKRWKFRKLRKLTGTEVCRLLWKYRISLKELSEQSI